MVSDAKLIALCIESSHARGMGHFYRALNLRAYLRRRNVPCIMITNNNAVVKRYVEEHDVNHVVVDYHDGNSDWESRIIEEHGIDVWINDRLATEYDHAERIKKNDVALVTYDDRGEGTRAADLNIAPFTFDGSALNGKNVLSGIEYLILDEDIDSNKSVRNKIDNVMVTLGGSDTYGVTVEVVKILKELDISATIHIGPSFNHQRQLEEMIDDRYRIVSYVPSLITEMNKYDMAITGGGVTPFEANAMGLPCLVISCEDHEVGLCKYLDSIGSSAYLGAKEQITTQVVGKILDSIDINRMSLSGMEKIPTAGTENVWGAVEELINAR